MTNPHYPTGCAEESQARGTAFAGDADNAWNLNFNNGNSNANNRNNSGYALAVRGGSPREYHGAPGLRDLHHAYRAAAAQKCSANQLEFETHLTDHLIQLQQELASGTWQPAPPLCFIATRPKTRQIHAPDFRDRVVHHWLMPHLEPLWEPRFIHDSYANRTGKGSHAAVNRLRGFVRQVHSGQGGGWYLQLDIHNFFNSIHRPTLWALLKRRMLRAGTPAAVQIATHALLRQHPLAHGARYRATEAERAAVPPHKRLENTAPHCGLPIGNLSSQFFANVYLDPLDQFIKHQLKAPRYLRYVDDFVLIHHSREQLQGWQRQIEHFLHHTLRLKLKPEQKMRPLTEGIDFLGYILYPTHTRVRRRVIAHARQALHGWAQRHVHGQRIRATPQDLRHIQSIAASYAGHCRHANAQGLQQDFHARFPWLRTATVRRRFHHSLEGQQMEFPT
jgi:RNA-directed DNA polymerase